MVESIFGGKATYPLGCYETNAFHPRLAERRLSMQSTHLKTISETGDDNVPSDSASVFENIANEGPTCYRRLRAMSLPAIYRDGSYLRIKRATNAPISCQKRRYSEPAGITSQQITHRLSLRSNDSYCVSDESENASCKRPSVKCEEAVPCAARESSFLDSSTPRRHSDPMCNVTEHKKELEISQERQGISKIKVGPSVTALSFCGNKPKTQTDSEQAGPPLSARKRKSSLVPVPFSSAVQDAQKARHKQSLSRPMSFPPSKKESKRHFSLPALSLKNRFFTRHVSTENEDIANHCDCNNNVGLADKQLSEESDETKVADDKYTANEDILVQWMKFFG